MRLDILDDQPRLKICTGYELRGVKHDHPIANISHYKHCQPLYEEMPGWQTEIGGCEGLGGPAPGPAGTTSNGSASSSTPPFS